MLWDTRKGRVRGPYWDTIIRRDIAASVCARDSVQRVSRGKGPVLSSFCAWLGAVLLQGQLKNQRKGQ